MEDLEQSSLEEKVNIGNLALFLLESYVTKEAEEANFRIKDEPSEIKNNDDISENYIKKETIELSVDEYEKEHIEFSTNDNEICQKVEEEISFNTETPTPALQNYSALKTDIHVELTPELQEISTPESQEVSITPGLETLSTTEFEKLSTTELESLSIPELEKLLTIEEKLLTEVNLSEDNPNAIASNSTDNENIPHENEKVKPILAVGKVEKNKKNRSYENKKWDKHYQI